MKANLNLSIPKPCAEKWENFTVTSTGGYCSSCSKVVVDFTRMTDEQVVKYFANTTTHTCGRFRPDQLKSYNAAYTVKVNPGLMLLKAGLVTLLLIIVNRPVSAQNKIRKSQIENVQHTNQSTNAGDSTSELHIVKGIVKGDGDNIPGVNVLLKGTSKGTTTDENGSFVFPDKLKEGDVLVFSFIGLVTKEVAVPKRFDGIDIQMQMCLDADITGEVAINKIYTARPRGFWSKLKSLF